MADAADEGRRLEGLGHEGVDAQADAPGLGGAVGPRREHDDGHGRQARILLDAPHHVEAAHYGHHLVGDDKVGDDRGGDGEARAAVLGSEDGVVGAQEAGDEGRDLQVVLHDQYLGAGRSGGQSGAVGGGCRGGATLGRGQRHDERGALALLAVKLYAAFHQLEIALDQVQAQARALAEAGCGRGAEHALEDERLVDVGDAAAVVGDGDLDATAARAYAARHGGAVAGVLAGVREQVGHHRLELHGVGLDQQPWAGGMEDELLARVVVAEDLEDAPAEVDHVECRQDEHVLAAVLEMLQLDGAVYHVVEAHGVVVDRLEAAAHVGVGGLFLHDAHGAEDHRQRRLQVVRYCRKEGELALDVLEGRLSLLLAQRPQGAPAHVPDDGRDDGQRGEHVDRDGPPRQGPWRGDPERHRERAAGRADGLDQQSAGAHFQAGERDGVCPLGHDDPAVGSVGRRRGELVHEALRRVGRVVERAHHKGDAAAVGNVDASAAAARLVDVEMAVAVAVHDESDGLVVGDIAQVAVIDFKDFVGTSEQDVAGDGVLVDSRVRLLRDRKERRAQGRAVPDAPYVAQGRDPYAVADLAHGEHRLVAAGVGEHDSAVGAVAVKDCGAAAEGAHMRPLPSAHIWVG